LREFTRFIWRMRTGDMRPPTLRPSHLLDLCDVFAAEFNVKFNTVKSVATRIGPGYDFIGA